MPGRIKRLNKYTSYFKLNKLYAFIGKSNLLCKFGTSVGSFSAPPVPPLGYGGTLGAPRGEPNDRKRVRPDALEMSGELETGMLRIPVLIQNL